MASAINGVGSDLASSRALKEANSTALKILTKVFVGFMSPVYSTLKTHGQMVIAYDGKI